MKARSIEGAVATHAAGERKLLRCLVVAVGHGRAAATLDLVEQRLGDAGWDVVGRGSVPDEPAVVDAVVSRAIADPDVTALFVVEGARGAPRRASLDVVEAQLADRIECFDALLRALWRRKYGAVPCRARSVAGMTNATAVFVLTGATEAVALALENFVLPGIAELASLLRPKAPGASPVAIVEEGVH